MEVPRLLVFDLDGTLIDSSLDLCNSVNATLEHLGRQPLPNSMIATYIGDGAAMLVRRALGNSEGSSMNDLDDALLKTALDFFVGYYRTHKLDNTVAYDGVLASLQTIRERHPKLPMAVLTNKPVRPSREICAALGLEPYFFQNYGGDSFATKKPDPFGLEVLTREASAFVPAESCQPLLAQEVVMIGDSDVDIATARRMGARNVGCAYGLAPVKLAAAQPDVTVNHPSEWAAALGL